MGAVLVVSFIGAFMHLFLLVALKSVNKAKGFLFHWVGVSMVLNILIFVYLLVNVTH